jgi:hypothetical protein
MVTVPQGRARTRIKLAVAYSESVDVPEWVLAPEMAVVGLDVRTFLDGTLAIAYCHLFQPQVMTFEEGALPFEVLVLNCLHYLTLAFDLFARCKITK